MDNVPPRLAARRSPRRPGCCDGTNGRVEANPDMVSGCGRVRDRSSAPATPARGRPTGPTSLATRGDGSVRIGTRARRLAHQAIPFDDTCQAPEAGAVLPADATVERLCTRAHPRSTLVSTMSNDRIARRVISRGVAIPSPVPLPMATAKAPPRRLGHAGARRRCPSAGASEIARRRTGDEDAVTRSGLETSGLGVAADADVPCRVSMRTRSRPRPSDARDDTGNECAPTLSPPCGSPPATPRRPRSCCCTVPVYCLTGTTVSDYS